MHVNLAGKKQGKHSCVKWKCSFSGSESLGRVRILLNLESEDKKQYKENLTLSPKYILKFAFNLSVNLIL